MKKKAFNIYTILILAFATSYLFYLFFDTEPAIDNLITENSRASNISSTDDTSDFTHESYVYNELTSGESKAQVHSKELAKENHSRNLSNGFQSKPELSIRDIDFPETEFLAKIPSHFAEKIDRYSIKATNEKEFGSTFEMAAGSLNYYLTNTEVNDNNRSEYQDAYNYLLFYTLLACWSETSCDDFILLIYSPSSRVSYTEFLTWSFILVERQVPSDNLRKTISILEAKMTNMEIDIAKYKAENFLYYANQEEFDFPSFLRDYYGY